jgi:hypothetical protein
MAWMVQPASVRRLGREVGQFFADSEDHLPEAWPTALRTCEAMDVLGQTRFRPHTSEGKVASSGETPPDTGLRAG